MVSFQRGEGGGQGPTGGFFNIGQVLAGNRKKSRVAGGFGSGRRVEIFNRVFSGVLFSVGYFRVIRVFRVFRYLLFFIGSNEPNELWLSFM